MAILRKEEHETPCFPLQLKTPKHLLLNALICELTRCEKWQEREHRNLSAFTENQTTRHLNLKNYDILTPKSADVGKASLNSDNTLMIDKN